MSTRTKPHPEVARINNLIFANGLTLTEILDEAEIKRSTWSRWKKGSEPKISSIERLDAAIAAALSDSPASI